MTKTIQELEKLANEAVKADRRTDIFEIDNSFGGTYYMFVEGALYAADNSLALIAFYCKADEDEDDDIEFSSWADMSVNLSDNFITLADNQVMIRKEGLIPYIDIAEKAGLIKSRGKLINYGSFDSKAYRCTLSQKGIDLLNNVKKAYL